MRSIRKDAARRSRRASAAVVAAMLLGVLAVAPARAVVFPDLYSLTVTPDQSATDMRAAAIDLAMRRLLTRITGVRDPGADADLAGLIADASSYVSFDGMVDRGRFRVEFYANQIDQALESLGKPVWGPERPLTLLWIAIDAGGGERVLLSDAGISGDTLGDTVGVGVSPETVELAATIRERIEAVADERGLPIRFPLLDLEDLTSVTAADIWGTFVEPIEAASERYGADAILIGRISADAFGTSVRWTLVHGGEVSTFGGTGVVDALSSVADGLALGADRTSPGADRPSAGSDRLNPGVDRPSTDGDRPSPDTDRPNAGTDQLDPGGDGLDPADAGLFADMLDPVADGLHWVADRFVQAYSFVGGARPVRLVVHDVSTLDDYGRVLSYLEGLSALQTIDVEAYEDDGGRLILRASARGDLSVLEQMVGLGRVLRLDERATSSVDNTLVLTLVGGSRR
ncbi:MAG TPA: DUF2066 domain-containing protein [Gammaproteobacteria bacterium]